MTTLHESLILTLMCGIKVCDYILTWKPDIDINVWYKGCDYIRWKPDIGINVWYKVCDYIRWKPDIDINVWYKGVWLH